MSGELQWGYEVELIDKVSDPARVITRRVNAMRDALDKLAEARFDTAAQGLGRFVDKVRDAAGTADRASTSSNGLTSAVTRLGGAAHRASTQLTFFQRTITAISAQFTASALVGKFHEAVAAIKDLVTVGADFQKQITFANENMNGTQQTLGRISAEAQRLGKETGLGAVNAAKGFITLGQAGYNASESVKLMKPIMHAAGANMISFDKAAGLVSGSLKTFNLDASQAGRVADVLTRGAMASYQTVGELGLALSYVGPVANTMGRSLEETSGVISVLADKMIRGSRGGTGFQRIISKLITPSKNLSTTLQMYGLTMDDVNPKTHSFVEIFEKLQPLAKNTGQVMKLFGDRGGPAFLAIMDAGIPKLREMTAAMSQGNGAGDIFNRMMDTVSGRLQQLKGGLEATKIAIFEGMKQPLKETVHAVAIAVGDFSSMVSGLGPVVAAVFGTALAVLRVFADAAARALGFGGGLSGIVNGLKSFTKKSAKEMEEVALVWAFKIELVKILVVSFVEGLVRGVRTGFGIVMTLASPVFFVINAVVTGLLRMTGFFTDSSNSARTWGEKVGLVIGVLAAVIAIKLAALLPALAIKAVWAWGAAMVSVFQIVAAGAAWLYGAGWGLMIVGIRGVISALGALGAALLANPITWYVAAVLAVGVAIYLMVKYWDDVKAAAVSALTWIRDHVVGVGVVLSLLGGPFGLVVALSLWLATSIVTHWDALKAGVLGAVDTVRAGFSLAWNGMRYVFWTVVNGMRRFWNDFTEFLGNIWQDVVEKVRDAWGTMPSWFHGVIATVRDMWRGVTGWIGDQASRMAGMIERTMGKVSGRARSLARDLREMAREMKEDADKRRTEVVGPAAAAAPAKAKAAAPGPNLLPALNGVKLGPSSGVDVAGAAKVYTDLRGRLDHVRGLAQHLAGSGGADRKSAERDIYALLQDKDLATFVRKDKDLSGDLRAHGLDLGKDERTAGGRTALDAGARQALGGAVDRASSATAASAPATINHWHISAGAIAVNKHTGSAEELALELLPIFQRLTAEQARRGSY